MATITIRAVDPDNLSVQQVVRVTVNGVFVSFRDTVNAVFPRKTNGEQRSLRGITFRPAPDADDDPFDLPVQ